MSDPKCAQVLLEAAERDILTLRSMSGEGRAGALVRQVRDLLGTSGSSPPSTG